MNEKSKESTAQHKNGAPTASPSATSFRRPDLLQVLNKNSKYKYRWLNFEKLRMNGGMHHNGWRAVTSISSSEEEIIKEHALESVKFVDGTVRRYEMVLAFMPVAEWQALKQYKLDASKAPITKIRRPDKGLDHHEFRKERGFEE